MEFLALKQALQDKFFPVIVLSGNDVWLKSRSLSLIEQSLDIENRQMNIITLEKPQSFADILSAVETDCFFSRQKLVVVEDFAFPQDRSQNEFKSKLSRLAKAEQDFCCLVFVDNGNGKAPTIDGVTVVDCNRLSQRDTTKWILSFCKNAKRKISDDTATMLASYCLNDMARISVEIQKLCDSTDDEVTASLVESTVKKDMEFVIFDLGKSIALRQADRVYETVKGLLAGGEDVRSLFTVLYNFFRRLYYIRITNQPTESLAKNLGVKPGAIGFLKESALRYKPLDLKKALGFFRECDVRIKQFFQEIDGFNILVSKLLAL